MVIYSLIASCYPSAINTKKLYNITYFPSGVYLKDLHNSISKECTYWKLWKGNLDKIHAIFLKKLSYVVLVQINASNIACSKFNAVTISSFTHCVASVNVPIFIQKIQDFFKDPSSCSPQIGNLNLIRKKNGKNWTSAINCQKEKKEDVRTVGGKISPNKNN